MNNKNTTTMGTTLPRAAIANVHESDTRLGAPHGAGAAPARRAVGAAQWDSFTTVQGHPMGGPFSCTARGVQCVLPRDLPCACRAPCRGRAVLVPTFSPVCRLHMGDA